MHVHINHSFCFDSNWGGMYNCTYMVVIKNRLGYDPLVKSEKDWTSLVEEHDFHDKERYDSLRNGKSFKHVSDKELREIAMGTTRRLKPKVFKWLEKNVENSKRRGEEDEKGFCVGTDSYNHRNFDEFTIFFYRRSDALKFIKTWSCYKKPTTYFDYFRGIRKELDLKTNKLNVVDEFTLA